MLSSHMQHGMTKMQPIPEMFARTIAEVHGAAGVVDHRRSWLWLGANYCVRRDSGLAHVTLGNQAAVFGLVTDVP
jgi:hypothetical protein